MTGGPSFNCIVVVGAGGLGREVRDAIDAAAACGGPPFGGFLDDASVDTDVIGSVETESVPAGAGVVVALGEPAARRQLAQRLVAARFAVVVHPSAVVSPSARLGDGCFVGAFGYVGPRADVDGHVVVNVHAQVGHDCVVAGFATLSPMAALNGASRLGEGCFLGTQSSVAAGVSIGAWSKVAAASRVTRDVDPGFLLAGNPAKGREMFKAPPG